MGGVPVAPPPQSAAGAHGGFQDAPPPYSEFEIGYSSRQNTEIAQPEQPPALPPRGYTASNPDAKLSSLPATSSRTSSPGTQEEVSYFPYRPHPQLAEPAPVLTQSPVEVEQEGIEGKSFWQNALEETRYFAGGLIAHPTETTKHYTILRHSGAVVFYRGPETSVAITIFSSPDHPLPQDRSLWLQQRGYSGDTGMKLKALVGSTSSWIHVTPTVRAEAINVNPTTERAWQRDIGKVIKDDHGSKSHVVRETHVVRIPAAATDGYFRILLCTGRTAADTDIEGSATPAKGKVLCPSPLFRIASTSTDSSVFRGAKLRTMPLELGVYVASTITNKTVGNYMSPVTTAVQNKMNAVRPGLVVQTAGELAYNNLSLQQRVDSADQQFAQTREGQYAAYKNEYGGLHGEEARELIGPDDGPQKPYPLKFQGRVVRGSGRGRAVLGLPTAALADIPEDVKHRLKGVYFGWACILPGRDFQGDVSLDWHEALILATPSRSDRPSVVSGTTVSVHMMHDFGNKTFFESKLKVLVMGFMRPWAVTDPADVGLIQGLVQDTIVAKTSLQRQNWGPESTLSRMKTEKSARTMSDKYVDTRGKIQKQIDRIPVHLAGVRTPGAELRDRAIGNGGYWISRVP